MNISFRTTAGVIALTIASLAVPSLAHAKRFGKSVAPARIGKAPAAPATPVAPTANRAAPATPATPATPAAPVAATPAAAPAPAAAAAPGGSGMMGTLGAAAVGAVAGSLAGNALAGAMTPDTEATAIVLL